MSELTSEYILEGELSYGVSNEEWKLIHKELADYDVGNVIHLLVYENRNDKELWAFTTATNSWADYDDEDFYPFRVEAREVTVTKYFDDKGKAVN